MKVKRKIVPRSKYEARPIFYSIYEFEDLAEEAEFYVNTPYQTNSRMRYGVFIPRETTRLKVKVNKEQL